MPPSTNPKWYNNSSWCVSAHLFEPTINSAGLASVTVARITDHAVIIVSWFSGGLYLPSHTVDGLSCTS